MNKKQLENDQKSILANLRKNQEPISWPFEGSFHSMANSSVFQFRNCWMAGIKFPDIKQDCGLEISLFKEGDFPKPLSVGGYF